AEKSQVLAPSDVAGRARAMCWVVAALNSIEPMISDLANILLFNRGEEWARLRKDGAEEAVRGRLKKLSDWLGDKDYLEDRFTVGDLMMVSVLRNLRNTGR